MATSLSQYAACRLVNDSILELETKGGSQPYYNGVVVIEDKVLVIDIKACNLQIYRRLDGKLVSTSHRLESIPMGVCLISKTEVAVWLYNSRIVILSFKSIDDVKLVNTFNVETELYACQSVAKWNRDKLIISGVKWDDRMLYWCVVNLTDGRVHSTHKVGRLGFGSAIHMAIKNDTIYISCRTPDSTVDNGVYAFDIYNPHTPKFVYRHHGFIPYSIMVDERNFIYVCDFNSNSIHQLTDSGQLVTTHTLSSDPHGIFYDDQHGVLCTTSSRSNVITVYRLEYSHQPGVPIEILNMDNRSIQLFEEALKDGKETVHSMRIMVVGHIGVGKTTLVKRLLGEEVNISERCSTEGIDVYVNCCDVSLSTHEWTRQAKDSEQDYRLQRLARVLNEQQSMKDKATREKQMIIPPQRETAHKSHEVTQIDVEGEESEVLYIRTPQQDIGQDLSSTASQQEESPAALAQAETIHSETNMVAMLKLLQENVYKLKQDTGKTAPLTIWDFAGQYAFYTTHQTFLTRRAIYLLVSDVSQQLTDLVADECYFNSDGIMKCKVHELIEVWLNYIHSCAPSPEARTPPVILVGTHVDKISQKQSSGRGKESEIKSITSEREEFTLPTASTLSATASNKQPRALTISGTSRKFLKPRKTKGIVEVTSVSSMSGAHAHPAEMHQKRQKKSRLLPGKKNKLETGGMAVVSTEKSTGEMILDANAEKISQNEICEKYFRKIRTYLKDKPTRFHLVDEDFAIDNTIVDSKLQDLKRKIVEVASQQPYWGEQIPARWLPLEQELMRLKAAGIKVIQLSLVEDLSQAGVVKISTEELDLFLRFQHDIGTILYFSMDILKDKIVLDPQWMIDALKSLITAEMFVLRSIPAVADKWIEFKESGRLFPELIDALWTKEKYPDFHDNKEHILRLMEQMNIIAKPKSWSEDSLETKVENCFLAPCMLNQKTPIEVIYPVPHPQMESSSVICYVFMGKYLPSPIFHRLIAACIAYWPIATKMNNGTLENLIFCGCCVFQLDHYHKMTINFNDYTIFMRVTRKGITDKTPSSKLCIEAREFVSATLTKIIGCLGQSLKFEQFIQCPEYKGDSVNSQIPVSLLKENQEVCCTCHDNVIESNKLLRFWFSDKASRGEKGGDTGKHDKVDDILSECQGNSGGKGGDTENTDIQDQILLQDHDVRTKTMTIPSKTCQTKGVFCSDPKVLYQILSRSEQTASFSQSRLEVNCLSVGLELYYETPANGNCFFEAVSSQLQRLNCGIQKSPQQLRQEVVAFMRTNRVLHAPDGTIHLDSFIYGETFEDYCTRMTRDGEWADHVVVVAMARKLQMDIMIVTSIPSAGPDDIIVWVVGQTAFHGNPILLGHIWESHYLSLQPIAPANLVPVLVGSSAPATIDTPSSAQKLDPSLDAALGSVPSPAVGPNESKTSITQHVSANGKEPSPTDDMQIPALGSSPATIGEHMQAQTSGSSPSTTGFIPSPTTGYTAAEVIQEAASNSTSPVMQTPTYDSTFDAMPAASSDFKPTTTDGLMQFQTSVSAPSQTFSSTSADVTQSPAVEDTDRFMHIARLLVNVGSRVLRRLLLYHTVMPGCTLDQYLANNKIDIDDLRKRKILNKSQMDILFPKSGSTNLGDYDITLLSALFTNVVLTVSQQELNMIQFLRDKRNEIFAHAKSVAVNSNDYQTFWNDICRTLESLSKQCNDPDFENEISREIQGIQESTVQGTSFLDTLQTHPRRLETLERLVQALISSQTQESNKASDNNDL